MRNIHIDGFEVIKTHGTNSLAQIHISRLLHNLYDKQKPMRILNQEFEEVHSPIQDVQIESS